MKRNPILIFGFILLFAHTYSYGQAGDSVSGEASYDNNDNVALRRNIAELRKQINALNRQLTDANNKAVNTQRALDDANYQRNNSIANTQQQTNVVVAERDAANNRYNNLNTEYQNLAARYEALNRQNQALRNALNSSNVNGTPLSAPNDVQPSPKTKGQKASKAAQREPNDGQANNAAALNPTAVAMEEKAGGKNVTEGDRVLGKDDKGRTIYEGFKGGQYYINANGNKSYIKKGTN